MAFRRPRAASKVGALDTRPPSKDRVWSEPRTQAASSSRLGRDKVRARDAAVEARLLADE